MLMRKADTAWSKYRVDEDIKLVLILITFVFQETWL